MKLYKIKLFLLVALLTSAISSIYGEVEDVKLTWNNQACGAKCSVLIEKELKNLNVLDEIEINSGAGIANLKWNPKTPFSYRLLKTATQKVGIGINNITLRVRGKVKVEQNQIAFYSLGDNTRFVLMSAPANEPGKQSEIPHPSLLELAAHLRETLERDAKQDKTLIIEGILYKPWQTSYLILIIEQIQEENVNVQPQKIDL